MDQFQQNIFFAAKNFSQTKIIRKYEILFPLGRLKIEFPKINFNFLHTSFIRLICI
jgi:hypothetical protein